MFPIDDKFMAQFTGNPADMMTRLGDLHRAHFDAARKMPEINTRALQQMSGLTDPQSFMTMHPAIVKSAMEEHVGVLMNLWGAMAPGAAASPAPAPTSSGPAPSTGKA